ncbi:MAG: DNA cytosine methyltransferase [Novosphingobium sp.]|nr:DNA cytosine methyltransferase [Novosphingobium sp.]
MINVNQVKNNKGINILSLFDGISCGHVALERAGIKVNTYFSSEIDKYAIQVTQKNYPNTVQLGDITKWKEWDIDFSKINIIFAGSPCQGFSFAGKQLNFDDPRSKLFFDFVNILNHVRKVNPKVIFLLENVRMKKEYQDVISEKLGVEPILINSALVSAQNRKRNYWTNIPNITQPEDKGILLKDIVHESCDYVNGSAIRNQVTKTGTHEFLNIRKDTKSNCVVGSFFHKLNCVVFESLDEYIVPFDKTLKILEKEVEKGKVGFFRKDSQNNRVYYIHDKAVTLCGETGRGAAKMGQYLFGCITPDRINKRQNGQRFSDGMKFYTLTAQDKHGILIEGYIRKLTPIECERLQTLPDNYTEGISNSQRYKCLGNGWTVDVIRHILNFIKERN